MAGRLSGRLYERGDLRAGRLRRTLGPGARRRADDEGLQPRARRPRPTYTAEDRLSGTKIDPEGGWTYKILADWTINDWASLRGGYNLAVRAPNVGELFLGKQEVYAAGAATNYGDPCSLNASAPFGANPATNTGGAAGAANALAICKALMTPTGATVYYANPQAPGTPSPFGFVEQVGNSALKAETAKTWTLGLVLRSPSQNPWLSGMSGTIDWYKIGIDNAIAFEAVDDIKAACLNQPAATAVPSQACSLLSRNPGTGQEDVTTIQYNNQSTIETSGIDVNFNWRVDMADAGMKSIPGAVGLNVLANWLDYFNTTSKPGAPVQYWAGTLGPTVTGVDAGAYKWKLNTTLSYYVGPGSVSLNWRHLPGVHSATYYAPGPSYTPSTSNTALDTGSYDVFGLYFNYTVHQNYEFRFGIDNLFDVDPAITGATSAIPGFTVASTGQGTTNEGFYDALGRRFFVGLHAKF